MKKSYKKAIFVFILWGGGFALLNAIELNQIQDKNNITTNYDEITNHSDIRTHITIKATIGSFINYGVITNTGSGGLFNVGVLNLTNGIGAGHITNFINYGSIVGDTWVDRNGHIDTVTNYGYMGGIGFQSELTTTTIINNLGIMSRNYNGNWNSNIGTSKTPC